MTLDVPAVGAILVRVRLREGRSLRPLMHLFALSAGPGVR